MTNLFPAKFRCLTDNECNMVFEHMDKTFKSKVTREIKILQRTKALPQAELDSKSMDKLIANVTAKMIDRKFEPFSDTDNRLRRKYFRNLVLEETKKTIDDIEAI